ncbi:hypothetical protein [Hymenobacter sp. BT730]|uniref:MutS-related protein n=1 Tax=Hymenobacter sp. BT730 TaxID=3063332 RepID=UPI0026E0F279|nr:hypothetical protein [Hymenobacter sp. BT730]
MGVIHIQDLKIEADILPLFNYTYNQEAEDTLLQLLHELPPSIGLIQKKQDIIKGFLANWTVLADFSYQKIALQEVRAFLLDVSHGRIMLEKNRLRLTVKLLLSEEARYVSRARCIQTISFLHQLQQRYLHRLNVGVFPACFQPRLGMLIRFLEGFSLSAYAQAIQEDDFSSGQMVRFARQLLAVSTEEIAAFWTGFNEFEAYWSLAKGMLHFGFVFPVFQEEGLQLQEFYHPVLPHPVKNTLALGPTDTIVVLTGPNMSGKSTLLKAVGLCVYLAHLGVGVPAASCQLPFFHSIVVAGNLADSLKDGYSHFMAELQNLKSVLQAAQLPGRTFAIFDELFRGTNVDDATEITQATVNGLSGFPNSCFMISTHLLQLETRLPSLPCIRAYCIECLLEESTPRFTYRLQPGWSSLKIGRLLFEKEGLYHLLQP